jgi:hypothetical protein
MVRKFEFAVNCGLRPPQAAAPCPKARYNSCRDKAQAVESSN